MLACDGLFDQLTYDDVAKILTDNIGDTSLTPAQQLVRAAKEAGSTDNITVIAVRLTVPANVGGLDTNASTDPDQTAKTNPSGKDGGGKMWPRSDPGAETKRSGESPVGRDTAGGSAECSHLSMKRGSDSELEVSSDDEEKCARDVDDSGSGAHEEEELGAFIDSGSSVDVQRSSSQGSCQNLLRLSSKVGSASLEDALLAVAAETEFMSHEFSPSSSGLSDVLRTSEDTSGQSPDDPSMEAGLSAFLYLIILSRIIFS